MEEIFKSSIASNCSAPNHSAEQCNNAINFGNKNNGSCASYNLDDHNIDHNDNNNDNNNDHHHHNFDDSAGWYGKSKKCGIERCKLLAVVVIFAKWFDPPAAI